MSSLFTRVFREPLHYNVQIQGTEVQGCNARAIKKQEQVFSLLLCNVKIVEAYCKYTAHQYRM